MLAAASQTLRAAGYEHYELSNYAQHGHKCRHNMVYWLGHSYYAFGVGAASFVDNRRFTRPKQLKAWQMYVDSVHDAAGGAAGAHVAGAGEEALSQQDRMLEGLMLQLRLRDGVNLTQFAADFGAAQCQHLLDAVRQHAQHGLVQLYLLNASGQQVAYTGALPEVQQLQDVGGDAQLCLRLADPAGLVVSNSILSDIFVALA